jgi:photosystem II stability/assembly factor-like uncharacterized protein
MPTPADLETRLRRYADEYDAEVPADSGFETRLLARIAVTSQTGPQVSLRRELALAALVLLFVAAVGITFAKLRSERPAPAHHQALSYVPSVRITPGPIDLEGGQFRMMTPEKGWAAGPSNGPSGAQNGILITEDGGINWRNVTPPGFSPTDSQWFPFFLDASHAWVVAWPSAQSDHNLVPTHTITVYRTVDAAQTWQSASFDGRQPGSPIQVNFADQHHGWLTYSTWPSLVVYQTADGGLHWQVANSFTLPPPEPSCAPSCRVLPTQPSCEFDNLSFRDASTVWATGRCDNTTAAYFYVSHDGGHSWQPQPLARPDGAPEPGQSLAGTTPVVFTSPQDGWFTLETGTKARTPETTGNGCLAYGIPKLVILYTTHDGGNTWLPVTLPNAEGKVSFANRQYGWFEGRKVKAGAQPPGCNVMGVLETVFTYLWMSSDGGRTWTALSTDANFPYPGELQFVSRSTGWFISYPPDTGLHPMLFRTTDGGHSWRQVMPTLTD